MESILVSVKPGCISWHVEKNIYFNMLIFRRPKSVLRAVFEASGFASEDSSL
jgi:hypothetical protein